MTRLIVITVASIAAIHGSANTVAVQSRPNFSGQWVLAAALYAGPVRGVAGAAGSTITEPTPTNVDSVAGVLNCGRGCTVKHSDVDFLVEDARFQDQSQRRPPVIVRLSGQPTSIADPTSPGRKIGVTAKWVGSSLQIDTADDPLSVTQVLTMNKDQLVVVSDTFLFKERRHQYTFKYDRK